MARAAELLAEAAASAGVRVTPVYAVTGAAGERVHTTSFEEAAEIARRVTAGWRAA